MYKECSALAASNKQRPTRHHNVSSPQLGLVAIWTVGRQATKNMTHATQTHIRNHPLVRLGIGPTNCSPIAIANDLTLGPLAGIWGLGHPSLLRDTSDFIAGSKHPLYSWIQEGWNGGRRELRRERQPRIQRKLDIRRQLSSSVHKETTQNYSKWGTMRILTAVSWKQLFQLPQNVLKQ